MAEITWIYGREPAPDLMASDQPQSDREIIARALCRFRRISENALLDGRPFWEAYLPEADTVLAALAAKA